MRKSYTMKEIRIIRAQQLAKQKSQNVESSDAAGSAGSAEKLSVETTCSSASELLKQMYEDTDFADCSIIVKSEEFKCHKVVLSMGSKFFKCMFLSNFKESSGSINLEDVAPKIFGVFREFLYSYNAEILNRLDCEDLISLFKCAHMYQTPSLISACERQLCTKELTSADNYLQVFELGHSYENETIIKATVKPIASLVSSSLNFKLPDRILQFELDIFKKWLSTSIVNCYTLLQRYGWIFEYMSYKINNTPKDERNEQEIRKNFDDLLNHVGFRTMTMEQINFSVGNSPNFDKDYLCLTMFNLIEMKNKMMKSL